MADNEPQASEGITLSAEQIAVLGREAERADVLAYLARRRANAATMAENSPEFAEDARARIRELDLIEGDVRAGLHEGAAAVADALEGEG